MQDYKAGNLLFYKLALEIILKRQKILINAGQAIGVPTGIGLTELIVASDMGQLEIVKLLLQHKNNINAFNKFGETALIRASLRGHKDVVAFLLSHGADKNVIDYSGKTALAWARTNNFTGIEKLLK